MIPNLDKGSILDFAPVDPDLWQVTFRANGEEPWTIPVIGFATLITYAAKDEGDRSNSRLQPVILCEYGSPATVWDYLQDWEDNKDRPQWVLERTKPQQQQAPCPACAKPTLYAPYLDRHLHQDGSDNQACWRGITRGEG